MSYIPDDGPDTGRAARTFLDRYEAIERNQPDWASLVDLGAYNGRLARLLCTPDADPNVDSRPGVAIDSYDGLRGDENVRTIHREVTARELGSIIRESDGDTLVLALSVLHHLQDWRKYVGVIERNARYAFIETANPDEVLPEAVAHDQSAAIWSWCEKRGTPVGESQGWDGRYLRTTWRIDFD